MTDHERRVLLDLARDKTPKIVKIKDLNSGAYLACADDLTLPGELTNCAHCNKPVKFQSREAAALTKLCPACAIKAMQSDPNPEFCATEESIRQFADYIAMSAKQN